MRKNGKNLLSLVLALVMAVGLLPVTAGAATSGTCGDNVTWNLAADGTLTISGTGEMANYSNSSAAPSTAPWYGQREDITSVVIGSGVTRIGNRAFYKCTGLSSATIPDGVTSIGSNAFFDCTGMTSVTIGNSVTNIGTGAFGGCSSLNNVIIGNSVTSIGWQAFFLCTSLTSVTIPNSVTSIDSEAFGVCTSLTSVIIPNSVTSMGGGAFGGCRNLTDIYYGGSEAQWNAIITSNFEVFNSDLANVTIHYGQNGPAPTNYTVHFDPNGGNGFSGKTVRVGETYGDLPMPTRDGYTFDGWYTSASGGNLVTASTIVTQTQDHTLYAHWTSAVDPYNLGDETYSFQNYGDYDSPGGHCFGMSMTSAGYHNNLLDIGKIGGNTNTPLYSLSGTETVKQPICYYQGIQGSYSSQATVAGGSAYLTRRNNITSDWQAVVAYVRDHSYDDTGLLQIGYRKDGEGGHAINFLRYENVNGQDRIYAYDNNFPTQETYFYRDSSGNVRQTPVQTFSGAIDCISLRDCRTYFDIVGDFDATHVLYMAENAASVEGEYTKSYMETDSSGEEYVMYEIPANVDRVTIIPNIDNATFIYMDKEYSFGKITDETRGEFMLASADEDATGTDASFRIYEDDSAASTQFTDVPAGSWYYDAVYWAVDKDIVSGTSPTTFTPNRTCTTTEIVTLLWHAAGRPASTAQLPFALNARLGFAEGALRWAYEEGIIDAAFDQTAPCTRAGAAKFLWQAFGSPATAVANSFTDVPAGAGYAPAVAWAVSREIVNGTSPTTFTPDTTCTRAEIVTLLYRAYK